MKTNKTMRIASVLLVLVLLSTCAISGTFAKYTSTANSSDSARVAYWGWSPATMNIEGLFATSYTDDNGMLASADAIAPGTKNSATFGFAYKANTNDSVTAPEVAYQFDVDVVATCDESIKNNPNIVWSLDDALAPAVAESAEGAGDGKAAGSFDALVAAIEDLQNGDDDDNIYNPGELPSAFDAADETHKISWEWKFDENNNDATDTAMGNADPLAQVSIEITVTATQLDTVA